jgi:hypothetical protein
MWRLVRPREFERPLLGASLLPGAGFYLVMSSVSSSPDALGVVWNLPTGVTSAALDPVVALAQAGLDLQEDLEHGGIGLETHWHCPR